TKGQIARIFSFSDTYVLVRTHRWTKKPYGSLTYRRSTPWSHGAKALRRARNASPVPASRFGDAMKSVAGNSSAPSPLRQSLTTLRILLRAGVIKPGRPKHIIRQMRVLKTWGPTIAGGYAVAHERMPDSVAIIDE